MGKGKRLRQEAQLRRATQDQNTYWHGGAAGRQVGDQLIPGIEVPGYRDVFLSQNHEFLNDYRPDFAYITTDRDLALDYAIQVAKGGGRIRRPASLYEVVPIGNIMQDPDYPIGVSFRCQSAQVRAVEISDVLPGEKLTGAGYKYMTWDDGSRQYDEDGYPLPNLTLQHYGITATDLRPLGYGADINRVMELGSVIMQRANPSITQEEVNAVRLATGGKL